MLTEAPIVRTKIDRAIIANAHSFERLGLEVIIKRTFGCDSDGADDFDGLARLIASPRPVIVVDENLPGLSRPDQIRRLHILSPATRIVVVCTQCSTNAVLALLSCGVHGIIPKSHAATDLTKAFALVASGIVYVPADMSDWALSERLNTPVSRERRATHLSLRQDEVLRLAAVGRSNKEIARQLSIAEGTVKVHLGAAFRNMGVSNRMHAVAALRQRDEDSGRPETSVSANSFVVA
jgi:DNA-binding NarL/FixJ family response regulator